MKTIEKLEGMIGDDYDFDHDLITDTNLVAQFVDGIKALPNVTIKVNQGDGSVAYIGYQHNADGSFAWADIVVNADGTGMYMFVGSDSAEARNKNLIGAEYRLDYQQVRILEIPQDQWEHLKPGASFIIEGISSRNQSLPSARFVRIKEQAA